MPSPMSATLQFPVSAVWEEWNKIVPRNVEDCNFRDMMMLQEEDYYRYLQADRMEQEARARAHAQASADACAHAEAHAEALAREAENEESEEATSTNWAISTRALYQPEAKIDSLSCLTDEEIDALVCYTAKEVDADLGPRGGSPSPMDDEEASSFLGHDIPMTEEEINDFFEHL